MMFLLLNIYDELISAPKIMTLSPCFHLQIKILNKNQILRLPTIFVFISSSILSQFYIHLYIYIYIYIYILLFRDRNIYQTVSIKIYVWQYMKLVQKFAFCFSYNFNILSDIPLVFHKSIQAVPLNNFEIFLKKNILLH